MAEMGDIVAGFDAAHHQFPPARAGVPDVPGGRDDP